MTQLDVLVEEPSMEQGLRLLLPRLIEDVSWRIFAYRGKPDLLAKLPSRLRGYRTTHQIDRTILVVIDADRQDCRHLKAQLEAIAVSAGLATRSQPRHGAGMVINRIAVEELEAWYFGDWAAVRAAYPKVPNDIPRQSRYRNPDAITGGTWEMFERILRNAGYMQGGLRKVEAAQAIVTHMVPDRNTSPSFRALCDALRDLPTRRTGAQR